jgi:integrase/recombinase XerD
MTNYRFKRIQEAFKEWLELLGYCDDTVAVKTSAIGAFLSYLEAENITNLENVEESTVQTYYSRVKQKINPLTGSPLRNSTLNNYAYGVFQFSQYLKKTGQGHIEADLPREHEQSREREALSLYEIQQLYKAIPEGILYPRDKAMLNVFYGCGLRANEGIQLDVSDILLSKRLIYVRKGKGGKERYVPFTERQREDFKHYLKTARPELARSKAQEAFLLNTRGMRMNHGNLLIRIKQLQELNQDEALKKKTISPHILRHSIATHLLEQEMDIEFISIFLGHKSLKTTQDYTHPAYARADRAR